MIGVGAMGAVVTCIAVAEAFDDSGDNAPGYDSQDYDRPDYY